ncbi:MAG: hypothetical protein QM770_14100 [Tepidisphaeraceae bacterium]
MAMQLISTNPPDVFVLGVREASLEAVEILESLWLRALATNSHLTPVILAVEKRDDSLTRLGEGLGVCECLMKTEIRADDFTASILRVEAEERRCPGDLRPP